jgi:hypothetical protein
MEPPPSIHLHIDRIILDGLPFTPADATPIRAALEAELTRLVGENFPMAPADSLRVDTVGSTHVLLRSRPSAFGHEIAASLGTTLSNAFAIPPPAP